MSDYQFLLQSRAADRWKRFGLGRRAGILFPLFSLHSKHSVGVGEFPDLSALAGWCAEAGLTLIQLLPLGDVGCDFRPYDAASSFALEPMHLSLQDIEGVLPAPFSTEIKELRRRFLPARRTFFDTGVKQAKLDLLRRMFAARKKKEPDFARFAARETDWLDAYAQYKVLKERFRQASWENWPEPLRDREPGALERAADEAADEVEFQKWLQWQLMRQAAAARKEVNRRGVLLFGDLPYLVSRDSADVWAGRPCFRLELSAGAPPDLYFAGGQVWGMPPYDWEEMKKADFSYLRRKIAYASHFYDAFRIDHFVGLFRVWTFRRATDGSAVPGSGAFEPADESVWDAHGRKVLDAILGASDMLPCAEDLGAVPKCSAPALRDYGIPGMDIQRWARNWETDGEWQAPGEYRPNSIAAISTHDMPPLELWWKTEAVSAKERESFYRHIGLRGGGDISAAFVAACLRASLAAKSIFNIQLFQDWFSLEKPGSIDEKERINFPGKVDEKNWRLLSRYSIEQMRKLKVTSKIKRLLAESQRLPAFNN